MTETPDPTTTPTPTEPHQDVLEEWAERLQCADVGVDFPWLTEEGYSVWHEQSEAAQEHYRNLLRVALSAGLQIPPAAAVSTAAPDCGCGHPASFHTPHCYDVCGCEVFHAAAAPDKREALARAFAEHHARKVVYAIDYEHADVALTALTARPAADVSTAAPDVREVGQRVARAILDDRQKRGDAADLDRDMYERGVQYGMSIAARIARTTAAALAARPAPVVSRERGALTLADAWDEGWRACAGAAGSASPHHNGPANPYRTVADAPEAGERA